MQVDLRIRYKQVTGDYKATGYWDSLQQDGMMKGVSEFASGYRVWKELRYDDVHRNIARSCAKRVILPCPNYYVPKVWRRFLSTTNTSRVPRCSCSRGSPWTRRTPTLSRSVQSHGAFIRPMPHVCVCSVPSRRSLRSLLDFSRLRCSVRRSDWCTAVNVPIVLHKVSMMRDCNRKQKCHPLSLIQNSPRSCIVVGSDMEYDEERNAWIHWRMVSHSCRVNLSIESLTKALLIKRRVLNAGMVPGVE